MRTYIFYITVNKSQWDFIYLPKQKVLAHITLKTRDRIRQRDNY